MQGRCTDDQRAVGSASPSKQRGKKAPPRATVGIARGSSHWAQVLRRSMRSEGAVSPACAMMAARSLLRQAASGARHGSTNRAAARAQTHSAFRQTSRPGRSRHLPWLACLTARGLGSPHRRNSGRKHRNGSSIGAPCVRLVVLTPRTLFTNACLLGLRQSQMHRLRLCSRKPGVDLPDQGFHRPPGRWRPATVDLPAIAANARELALELTHKITIGRARRSQSCRPRRRRGGPWRRDINHL